MLADICRDLGIPPSHELWDELYRAIKEYGGNSTRLYFDWLEQAFPIRHILARYKAKPEAQPTPAGTGPPAGSSSVTRQRSGSARRSSSPAALSTIPLAGGASRRSRE